MNFAGCGQMQWKSKARERVSVQLENGVTYEAIGYSHRTPGKTIRRLPDTPEQFLRSESLSDKSDQSFCVGRFENPQMKSEIVKKEKFSLKLENFIKNKEKRLSEMEMSLKIEKEMINKEKNEVRLWILKKKEKMSKEKEEIKVKKQELRRKMEEIEKSFLEVKGVIFEFKKEKEQAGQLVRAKANGEELLENIKGECLDVCKRSRAELQRSRNKKSFSVADIDETGWRETEKNEKLFYEHEKLVEKIRKLKEGFKEKIESVEGHEGKYKSLEEKLRKEIFIREKTQTMLEFFKRKCEVLESQLKAVEKNQNSALLHGELQIKVSKPCKFCFLALQNPEITNKSLQISSDLQEIKKKEDDLLQLSSELSFKESIIAQKETELAIKSQELDEAAALIKSINEELTFKKKSQEEEQQFIQDSLELLKKVAGKQMKRENLLKIQEEKLENHNPQYNC